MEKEVLRIVVPIVVIFFLFILACGIGGVMARKKTMIRVKARLVDVELSDAGFLKIIPKYALLTLIPDYVPVYEYTFNNMVYRTRSISRSRTIKRSYNIGEELEIGINKDNPELIWEEFTSGKEKVKDIVCNIPLFICAIMFICFFVIVFINYGIK